MEDIRQTGQARASIEFSFTNDARKTAATFLADQFDVPSYRLGLPIGVAQTDELFDATDSTQRPADTGATSTGTRTLVGFVRRRA